MHLSPAAARPLIASMVVAMMLAVLAPFGPRGETGPIKVRASQTTLSVHGTRDFAISSDTSHFAIHWRGEPTAHVTVALSTDGRTFSAPSIVEVDDPADGRDLPSDGETYGSLIGVDSIRVVRVHADRPLAKVTVLALDASGPAPQQLGLGAVADGATAIPGVISRAAWGADESLRFDGAGDERWPREYFPLSKLVVHHTAGRNNDPDPAATVRAIYYYHAVGRRWGDIGYNYLIDEAGRIYEGRYARDFWNGMTPTSDNPAGLTVAGGHALHFNLGSMGISLLGTFTSQAPTPAARASLVRLLAWASAKYRIDPLGRSTYTNPQEGNSLNTFNIGGHRDYQATGCPGGVLYGLLPAIRNEVAAAMNLWPGSLFNPPRLLTFSAGTYTGYKFTAGGGVTGIKAYTLARSSSAPTSMSGTVPARAGSWYYITAGVWAGYWVQASSRIGLSPALATPTLEQFGTARPVTVPAGTKAGYKFNGFGQVISSKPLTFAAPTVIWATMRSTIPTQLGRWYYVTVGAWEGYWVLETAGMTLGAPPPPLPQPIAIYKPPRVLQFAAGTYVGYQYSAYGVLAGSYSYTLTRSSAAPTSRYSKLPGQTGNWYYIVDGVWESYWIRESAGTTLTTMTTAPLVTTAPP